MSNHHFMTKISWPFNELCFLILSAVSEHSQKDITIMHKNLYYKPHHPQYSLNHHLLRRHKSYYHHLSNLQIIISLRKNYEIGAWTFSWAYIDIRVVLRRECFSALTWNQHHLKLSGMVIPLLTESLIFACCAIKLSKRLRYSITLTYANWM